MAIAKAIERAKQNLDKTQAQLAERYGLSSQDTLTNWKNGRTESYKLDVLARLFQDAEMSLDDALGIKPRTDTADHLDRIEQLLLDQSELLREQGQWYRIAAVGGILKSGVLAETPPPSYNESDTERELRALLRRMTLAELQKDAIEATEAREEKGGKRGRA